MWWRAEVEWKEGLLKPGKEGLSFVVFGGGEGGFTNC